MALQNHLVVFAKWPRAGQVKTRLAQDVGTSAALQFYRKTTAALLCAVGQDTRWQTHIAIAPDDAPSIPLFAGYDLQPQGQGDLGARMHRTMANAPPGPVVVIGSDIPGITSGHIAQAFRLLGRNDAVFGPAHDGGYWLVGLKRRPHLLDPFSGVRWSSVHTLGDSLRNLRGSKVALLDTLVDVDRGVDMRLSVLQGAAESR